MFCPCAKSYFVVEGLQAEQPRLVRPRFERSPALNARAPLPVQIRPLSSRGSSSDNSGQRDGQGQGQGHGYGYGYGPGKVPAILITPIPEEAEQGPGSQVKARPRYSRESGLPRGILKVPTEEFPFDNHDTRRHSQSWKIQKPNGIREEVGKPSSPGYTSDRNPPASDVVKVRVYRRNRNMTRDSCDGIIAEVVKFREGDIVVRSEAKAERTGALKAAEAASTEEGGAQETTAW
ncbi:hypothetical protein BJX66DRAFT_249128 [Aspergillus keveii]|uniref:Uncharacterized protein n=1 Tax=Aspergillus keveii TaxID=714993 RepID=A0ABR4G0Y1_9EURO